MRRLKTSMAAVFTRKFLLAGVFLLPMILMGCGAAPQEEEALEPIVKVAAGNMNGSGVIYDRTEEQLVIVTAGHVLEPVRESGEAIEVVFGDEYSVETTSYIISETSETAFICISPEQIPDEHLNRYEPVLSDKARYDALQEGASMVFKGASTDADTELVCRGIGEMLYSWIYVEDFQQYMMLIKGESFPGMSGGGVFDGEGYFLGILCGINNAGETAVVPLNVIIAEYIQNFF